MTLDLETKGKESEEGFESGAPPGAGLTLFNDLIDNQIEYIYLKVYLHRYNATRIGFNVGSVLTPDPITAPADTVLELKFGDPTPGASTVSLSVLIPAPQTSPIPASNSAQVDSVLECNFVFDPRRRASDTLSTTQISYPIAVAITDASGDTILFGDLTTLISNTIEDINYFVGEIEARRDAVEFVSDVSNASRIDAHNLSDPETAGATHTLLKCLNMMQLCPTVDHSSAVSFVFKDTANNNLYNGDALSSIIMMVEI